jgi:hypothetical protein
VAQEFTHPEYIYLLRLVDTPFGEFEYPSANIAKFPLADGVALELAALNADGPKALLALTLNVYAVQLVKHATVIGDVVPVPVLKLGQETAV